ncbi:MAG: MurR/RpiR family transcriptional regulator [Enterococcus sp.]
MLLFDKLTKKQNFTDTEVRIASYILEHLTVIPAIRIEELAQKTYTSHSAVIRLCKKLGYTGFKEFKLAIFELVHTQQFVNQTVDANFPFQAHDSPAAITKKIADLSINAITQASAQVNPQELRKAAIQLDQGQRIFIFARGDSQIRGRSFQNKLAKLNKFAILAEAYCDEAWVAANITKNDCCIFISYSGLVNQYERIMNYFAQQKIPTILLTGNPDSLLYPLATIKLLVLQEERAFLKISTFASQIAFEYLLDTLYSLIYAHHYQSNLTSLQIKQRLLDSGDLAEYHKPTGN